jgi:DNA helicase-2/ATP-dependent DNA helicase PcrA
MEIHALTESLNDAQRKAVTAPLENILVLAGAGSGKTRVLTHRIAWLLKTENYSPFHILAVTFTNKASHEMRGRLETLLGFSTQNLWVGTFHGIAHRLLRIHWQEAQLGENFQIIDSDDQYRAIRRIVTGMGLDEKQWSPKQIQWFINGKKDEGLRASHIKDNGDLHLRTLMRIYQQYEQICQQNGLVDFAELMLRAHELWQSRPDILAHYQARFKHVLVDEFQDTNMIQYEWIRAISQQGCLMAVGDDDQSIYGWRGAKVENMHRLSTDFAPLATVVLEENYRSTGNILHAANTLIAINVNRLGKNLHTKTGKGEKLSVYAAFNEVDEARFIVDRIREYYRCNGRYLDCAILYRSNAQSRVLEEALIQAGIPYRIYGGLRFFERAEIKDALCYLRLIAHRDDDSAFERVINMPTRGIGEQTLTVLRNTAREHQISLWKSACLLIKNQQLTARALTAVQQFLDLIERIHAETKNLSLSELTEHTLHTSRLLEHYRNEKGEKGQTRIENLQELISATKQFQDEGDNTDIAPLSAFLANAALEAGETQSDSASDYIQMMTLHSAKGLEFPLVFLAGLEEGLFPHQLSMEDPQKLMEERRLCYVGMTRAMKKLYLTYAETRRLYGNEVYHRPSRFIRELPSEVMEEVRLRTQISRPFSPRTPPGEFTRKPVPEEGALHLGQHVFHPTFGEGVVLNYEGNGPSARVQVKFKQVGAKWLVAAYAKLEPVV